MLTVILRSAFEENGEYYPHVFLNKHFYESQMSEYDRIGISEGIYNNKTYASNKRDICCYWYFLDKGFKYEAYLCNDCHDLMQKAMNFNDVAIFPVNSLDTEVFANLM